MLCKMFGLIKLDSPPHPIIYKGLFKIPCWEVKWGGAQNLCIFFFSFGFLKKEKMAAEKKAAVKAVMKKCNKFLVVL